MSEVSVASVRERSPCPACGEQRRRVRAYRESRVRDNLVGELVTTRARRRRFERDGCGRTHLETHPEVKGKFTVRFTRPLTAEVEDEHPGGVPPQEGGVAHAPGFGGSTSGRNRRVGGRRRAERSRRMSPHGRRRKHMTGSLSLSVTGL